MISDFLGQIGGLEFITSDQAFTEAAEAQRQGNFGKPDDEEINVDIQAQGDLTADSSVSATDQ